LISAAGGGLEPVPADRFRGAFPHQSCSCARQQLESAVIVLVAHVSRITGKVLGRFNTFSGNAPLIRQYRFIVPNGTENLEWERHVDCCWRFTCRGCKDCSRASSNSSVVVAIPFVSSILAAHWVGILYRE